MMTEILGVLAMAFLQVLALVMFVGMLAGGMWLLLTRGGWVAYCSVTFLVLVGLRAAAIWRDL